MEQFAKGAGEIGPVLSTGLRAVHRQSADAPGPLPGARCRRRRSGMRAAQEPGPDGIQAYPHNRHGHDRVV